MLFASQGSREITGYSPEQLLKHPVVKFGSLIDEADKTAVSAEIKRAVAEKRPYRCTYRITTADETIRWVLDRGQALFAADGTVTALAGFITEHTEQIMVLEERNRLARELHDSVTQSLYSVTLFAEAGRTLSEAGEMERASAYFGDVLETGQQALKEMRLLVHKLRPSLLEKEGFIRALQYRLNAVEGRAGVKNQFVVDSGLIIPPEIEEALFQIAQEALNNSIKHAAAREVVISLQAYDGWLEMRVVDDGRGFDVTAVDKAGGLGLTSMAERAAVLNGRVNVESGVGQGTAIVVRLPVWPHE